MKNLLADNIQIAPEGGFSGLGTGKLNQINSAGAGVSTLTSVISMAIGVMTIIAIIWFIFTLVTGAISIIGAGGDKQALESAKKKITTGIVGLVIVIAAVFIVSLIGSIFKIDFLNLSNLFYQITGQQIQSGDMPTYY